MGAVGLPEFDNTPPSQRPERGLLGLRGGMEVFANLRPVRAWPALIDSSPLKNHLVEGIDMSDRSRADRRPVLRHAARHRVGHRTRRRGDRAYNTMNYSRAEIARVAHMAFKFARKRRKKLTSVDKPNVLECSQLWRKVVTEIGAQYPDVELDHMLVDTCAMQLVLNPKRFDVILTENMFGDILSDEGAVLAGSIGMLPSASLGEKKGLYEPVHGSAPDIAGQNKANPLGAIGSCGGHARIYVRPGEGSRGDQRGCRKGSERGPGHCGFETQRKAAHHRPSGPSSERGIMNKRPMSEAL